MIPVTECNQAPIIIVIFSHTPPIQLTEYIIARLRKTVHKKSHISAQPVEVKVTARLDIGSLMYGASSTLAGVDDRTGQIAFPQGLTLINIYNGMERLRLRFSYNNLRPCQGEANR